MRDMTESTREFVETVSASAPSHPLHELENYNKLVARAIDVFGDEIKASLWLSLPNPS